MRELQPLFQACEPAKVCFAQTQPCASQAKYRCYCGLSGAQQVQSAYCGFVLSGMFLHCPLKLESGGLHATGQPHCLAIASLAMGAVRTWRHALLSNSTALPTRVMSGLTRLGGCTGRDPCAS